VNVGSMAIRLWQFSLLRDVSRAEDSCQCVRYALNRLASADVYPRGLVCERWMPMRRT
jgi:hypothetical protein